MSIRDILRMLRPLKNRIHFNTGLICFFICLSAAGVVTTALAYVSLWLSIPYLLRSILYIYIAFAVVGILISVFSGPRTKSLIKTADTLGLKERLTTAWQLQKEESIIAHLQRQDTFKIVSNTDFKRLYPIQFPIKLAMVLVACLIFTSASFMIPSYARENAGQIEHLQGIVNEQLKELEKVNKELKKNDDLKESELEKILEETARLADELKKARTEEDALKSVSRAENELEKLDWKEQLNKLGEAFSQNEMTSDIGEAVKNDSMTDMKQALEQLIQQLEQEEISPGKLAEMLKQVSEQVKNDEVTEQLQKAAEQLASDSQESQDTALQNLDHMLSGMMQSQESTGLGQALGQLSQAMRQAKSSISQVDSSLSAGSQNSQGALGQSQGQSQGQGTGQKTTQGSSSGTQPGQTATGSGQASGKGQVPGEGQSSGQSQDGGGSGAGEGSTNKDAGYTGSEKPGGRRDVGEGYEEEFEQLYDPDHLGGGATPSYVNGQKQDGGNSSYSQADQIPVQKGAILPYREVLTRYSNEAASYMEKTEIPAAMKEIVRKYFESLE